MYIKEIIIDYYHTMISCFILDSNFEVIPVGIRQWRTFFDSPMRRIGDTYINDIRISTIFIGLDNNIFETIVFYNDEEGTEDVETRYGTYIKALVGHNDICNSIRADVLEY